MIYLAKKRERKFVCDIVKSKRIIHLLCKGHFLLFLIDFIILFVVSSS